MTDIHDTGTERTQTISQLCRDFNVTPRSLRFYEQMGLLAPGRHGVARRYGRRDRARLVLILRGKRLGLSLTDIREILAIYDEGEVAQSARVLEACRRQHLILQERRRDLDETLGALEGAIERLARSGGSAPHLPDGGAGPRADTAARRSSIADVMTARRRLAAAS